MRGEGHPEHLSPPRHPAWAPTGAPVAAPTPGPVAERTQLRAITWSGTKRTQIHPKKRNRWGKFGASGSNGSFITQMEKFASKKAGREVKG